MDGLAQSSAGDAIRQTRLWAEETGAQEPRKADRRLLRPEGSETPSKLLACLAMSTLIPEMALDFQKVAGHLVQLLLNVISSAHCRLDDLLRIFSHVTPLEPASSRGPEPSLEGSAAAPPPAACQRGGRRRGRASPRTPANPVAAASRTIGARRPCHYRATSISPEGSPADTHGQRGSARDLARPFRQDVAGSLELALQAGDRPARRGPARRRLSAGCQQQRHAPPPRTAPRRHARLGCWPAPTW
jgi:hypothetical protein